MSVVSITEQSVLRDVESAFMAPLAMEKVGAAALTLGYMRGVARLEGKKRLTYMAVKKIAAKLCIGERNAHNQIEKLCRLGWLRSYGRERPATRNRKRRTVTYEVTSLAEFVYSSGKYLRLPLWLCPCFTKWSERALLAAVIDRELLRGIVEEYGEVRDTFSLRELQKLTGLSRPTIVSAKLELQRRGVIEVYDDDFGGACTITLNPDCMVDVEAGKPTGLAMRVRTFGRAQ